MNPHRVWHPVLNYFQALAFRKGSQQLYSASFDRTLKLFDLSVMGFVETLFGHQDRVVALDALRHETAVSAGARDRTVRFWKVVDETQLVFRGGGGSKLRDVLEGGLDGLDDEEGAAEKPKEKERTAQKEFVEGSLDCVALVDETTFVSGGDSGSLCVWTTAKKKPQFSRALAHGLHETLSETEGVVSTPRWITALACLRYADLIASGAWLYFLFLLFMLNWQLGSWGGDIRLWKLDLKQRALTLVGTLEAPGFVNSLQILSLPRSTVADFPWANPGLASAIAEADNAQVNGAQTNAIPNGLGGLSKSKALGQAEGFVVVAGLGQEPRLGRWMKLKEGGAVNGCRVFALRTLARLSM